MCVCGGVQTRWSQASSYSTETVFCLLVLVSPHGLADLHLSGAGHLHGMLPGERVGGLGRVFEADLTSAYLLFRGVSGRG